MRGADLLAGAEAKNVKDGGCLACGESETQDAGRLTPESDIPASSVERQAPSVYALKGNNRYEFFAYNTDDNSWTTKESIPAVGRSGKKKAVKKGSALTALNGKVYGFKGNNTLEMWCYDPTANSWAQKADVPIGAKNLKEGTGAVAVSYGGSDFIYLLRGAGTQDFHRYNITTDAWESKAPAPLGASGKSYKNGSALATNGTTIWALKGSYNELAAYDIATDAWTTKTSLPLIGSGGKKKKVKDGAGVTCTGGLVYAIKGGNTREFWSYVADSDKWLQLADEPSGGGKNVKGGGALVAGDNALFALKGNNTLEFFRYGLPAYSSQLTANRQPSVQSSLFNHQSSLFNLRVSPNPWCGSDLPLAISYSLPKAGNISLKLYDITGKLVTTLAEGYRTTGSSSLKLQTSSLAGGIYLIRLETETGTTTTKLIVE